MQCRGASAGERGSRPSAPADPGHTGSPVRVPGPVPGHFPGPVPGHLAGRLRRRYLAVGLVIGIVGVMAACTEQSAAPPVTVPPTVAPLAQKAAEQTDPVPTLFFPPGFVAADTRGVELPELDRGKSDEPPIPVFGGDARISGTVFGPDGPVEGGVVRLERFVGGRGGYADVPTTQGGRWEAVDVFGGHYRVRAWKKKNLVTVEPQVGYVKDVRDSNVELSIGVEKHEAKRLQAALDNGNPTVGQLVTLLVLHDQEEVDDNGIVQGAPFRDTDIEVALGDNWEMIGEPTGRTGADGFARFSIRCKNPGKHEVTVSGDSMSATVTLPECLEPEPGTAPDTSTSTSSSVPDGETTTTSTTAPPPFPVGSSFTTPYLREIPAGTYISLTGSRACSTEYEVYVFSGWNRSRTDGSTIVVPFAARNLLPRNGTLSCTFARIK